MALSLIFSETKDILPMKMRVRRNDDRVGSLTIYIVADFQYTGMEIVKALLKCF